MNKVQSGLDILCSDPGLQKSLSGKVGYLCHAASVNCDLVHGMYLLKEVFGDRFVSVFSPQHGLYGSDQDNMIETDHSFNDFFKVKVYSLYSETRIPTDDMLRGLDHLIIDLQDVGSRIYTYIYTMLLTMKACGKNNVKVWILDRPNPVNGNDIEGNILDPVFKSFVGMYPIPMRHALTAGEIAQFGQRYWEIDCGLRVISMIGWQRSMFFDDTGLPWVMPSPNMPNTDTALVYPGSVLFEGTMLSEGRGTTKSLEIFGHPAIEPFEMTERLEKALNDCQLKGIKLRPLYFKPVFQKFMDTDCGGWQMHITNRQVVRPWKITQVIFREIFQMMGSEFQWKQPPYEYEYEKMPIDILNGTDQLRLWVEKNSSYDELMKIEIAARSDFMEQRGEVLLY